MQPKVCKVCGKEFQSNSGRAWLCSDECRKIQGRLNNNAYADRKRATLPDNEVVECKICGKQYRWLAKHLRCEHGMKLADYQALYPSEVTVSESTKQKLSDKAKGENNPGWQHGGSQSPWSYKSKYHTPDQIQAARALANKNLVSTTQLEYYLAKGYDLETAKQMRSERQRTFTKQKCIARLGTEQGLKRFLQRQVKWHRSFPKSNYSKISQKLFWAIYEQLPEGMRDSVYFAEHDRGTGAYNSEYTMTVDGRVVKPDFILLDSKQIIEFNGVYWHNRPGRAERDSERNSSLIKSGYSVKVVCESEYRKAPGVILSECLQYLTANKHITANG